MIEASGSCQGIVVASAEHAGAVTRIYRSVLIDPQVFLDLASPSAQRSGAARQLIKARGGFLSAPVEADLQMGFEQGLVMVFLQDGEVVGYNRYATHPAAVQRAFFAEFQLDSAKEYSRLSNFQDWSGSRKLNDYKTLTGIHWVDQQQAVIAAQAVQAGLQGGAAGRLAWSIDAAVVAENQGAGIAKALSAGMRRHLRPGVGYLAYRVFDIRKVNETEIHLNNVPSWKAFVDASSKLFACTEEVIRVREDIILTVRWNHWLRSYDP